MRSVYKRLIVTVLISTSLGVGATAIIASSENGYVAGFVVVPLLLLIGLISLILIIVGLITLGVKGEYGPFLLLAAILIPGSFLFSAITAKEFELGAYREEPMIPLIPENSNIIIFKKGTTEHQVNDFWEQVLSVKRSDNRGHDHLPGVKGIGRMPENDGHEMVEFHFLPSAAEDPRQRAYALILSSPIVLEVRENVSTRDYLLQDNSSVNDNPPRKGMKTEQIEGPAESSQ